jgi:hypothetical protein
MKTVWLLIERNHLSSGENEIYTDVYLNIEDAKYDMVHQAQQHEDENNAVNIDEGHTYLFTIEEKQIIGGRNNGSKHI